MRVLIFGATGMVGQGVLRECLLDPGVPEVLAVGRTPTGVTHPKLRELLHQDFTDFSSVADELRGFDACFFCLGVSASGLTEEAYHRITYDFTLALAQTLAQVNPELTFIYVSGMGADSSERGRWMWARVKGKTENALLRLPFKAAYIFRPGLIQPLFGARSRTAMYRRMYALLTPVLPLARRLFPGKVITTEELGRAMLEVARRGADKPVLLNGDLATLAQEYGRTTGEWDAGVRLGR